MGPPGALLSLLLGGVCAQLEVVVHTPVVAQLGSQAVLPCTFSVGSGSISPQELAVSWHFQGNELVSYDNVLTVSRPGVSLAVAQLVKGNASLILHNVSVRDQGAYQCMVLHTPDRGEQTLLLHVLATPMVAVPSKAVLRGEQNLLKCTVSGFYPADIVVTWLRAGQVLLNSSLPLPQRNPDSTFSVSSSLTLQPTEQDQGVTFSCRVQHVALPQGAVQRDFQLVFGASPTVHIHAPTFVPGEAQVVTCDVSSFYPEAIAVNWLVDGVRTEVPAVNDNNTFSLESFYQYKSTAGSEGTKITCEVQHETLSQALVKSVWVHLESRKAEVSDTGMATVVAVAAAVVVAVFMVCAGALLCMWKRMADTQQTFSASEVVGPKVWVVGQYVSLVCIGYQCPAGTQARWTKYQNGNEIALPGGELVGSQGEALLEGKPAESHEEAQPLVAHSVLYKVQMEELPLGGLAAMLMILARSPEDQGARYRCCFISKDRKMLSTKEFGNFILSPPGTVTQKTQR
ncbi:LOW QUALITY PROTEIN: signal-regulatory protein beta-1-like [Carettochelys insculpta]|uniref:LOW QUALITY PROTEIN: signal-regulatory protein beta-1-like n=1 Tax=Carettochelys insculpta TaxID=44489 RepID=UPI003EBEFA03